MTVVGQLAVHRERLAQLDVGRELGGAVDAQRHADARHEEQQPDAWIDDEVAKRVEPVVAAAIGHQAACARRRTRTKPGGSPRGEQSSPPGPDVATRTNGEASM